VGRDLGEYENRKGAIEKIERREFGSSGMKADRSLISGRASKKNITRGEKVVIDQRNAPACGRVKKREITEKKGGIQTTTKGRKRERPPLDLLLGGRPKKKRLRLRGDEHSVRGGWER